MKLKTTIFGTLLSLALFVSCDANDKEIITPSNKEVDDSRPDNAITYKEMAAMFNAYADNQKKVLDANRLEMTNNENDAEETVSSFYNLKDLKQYIAYLERISNEKNIELTGIRIFQTAYPKDYSIEAYRGRQTLVFMPTANIDGKDLAFEPLYSESGKPIGFENFLNQFLKTNINNLKNANLNAVLLKDDLESSGANRIRVTPPY